GVTVESSSLGVIVADAVPAGVPVGVVSPPPIDVAVGRLVRVRVGVFTGKPTGGVRVRVAVLVRVAAFVGVSAASGVSVGVISVGVSSDGVSVSAGGAQPSRLLWTA